MSQTSSTSYMNSEYEYHEFIDQNGSPLRLKPSNIRIEPQTLVFPLMRTPRDPPANGFIAAGSSSPQPHPPESLDGIAALQSISTLHTRTMLWMRKGHGCLGAETPLCDPASQPPGAQTYHQTMSHSPARLVLILPCGEHISPAYPSYSPVHLGSRAAASPVPQNRIVGVLSAENPLSTYQRIHYFTRGRLAGRCMPTPNVTSNQMNRPCPSKKQKLRTLSPNIADVDQRPKVKASTPQQPKAVCYVHLVLRPVPSRENSFYKSFGALLPRPINPRLR